MQNVTETDFQKLYSPFSGTKNENPTLLDEIQYAREHTDFTVLLQLISEIHGAYSGMTSDISSSISNSKYKKLAKSLSDLLPSSNSSSIGRKNTKTLNDLSPFELRKVVQKIQQLHPFINQYIQENIDSFPYFQQISENVGSLSRSIQTTSESSLEDRSTCKRLRTTTSNKLFAEIKDTIETSSQLIDMMFARSIRVPEDNNSFVSDTSNLSRENSVKSECKDQTILKFGPLLKLTDTYFPINYRAIKKPTIIKTKIENIEQEVLENGTTIPIQVELGIAQEENKLANL